MPKPLPSFLAAVAPRHEAPVTEPPPSLRGLRPLRALAHPAWWLALAVLVLNDHVAKKGGVLPSLLTGKASDLAGLLVAPPLLAAVLRVRTRRGLVLSHIAPATVFAAIKTSALASAGFTGLLATFGLPWRNVVDPTDLIALPMVILAYHLFLRRMTTPIEPNAWSRLGVLAGVPAVLASGSPGGANQGGAEPGSGEKGIAVGLGQLAVDPTGRYYLSEQDNKLVLGDLREKTSRALADVPTPDRLAFFTGSRTGIYVFSKLAGEVLAYDIDGKQIVFRASLDGVIGMRNVPGSGNLLLWTTTELHLLDGLTGKTIAKHVLPENGFVQDVDVVADGSRVVVTHATVWTGEGQDAVPAARVDVLASADLSAMCSLSARTCASELVLGTDGGRAFLAPTTCAKDPVTVLDVTAECKVVKVLAGFGPVALSPDGATAVAFLDRDTKDPNAPPVPADVKASDSRYHLSFIDTATLEYTTYPVGESLPRYALSTDGSLVLLDALRSADNVKILDIEARALRTVTGPHTLLEQFVLLPDGQSIYTLTGDGEYQIELSAKEGVVTGSKNTSLLRVDLSAATSKKLDVAFTPASLNRLPDGSSVLVRDTTGAVHMLSPEADQIVGTVGALKQ